MEPLAVVVIAIFVGFLLWQTKKGKEKRHRQESIEKAQVIIRKWEGDSKLRQDNSAEAMSLKRCMTRFKEEHAKAEAEGAWEMPEMVGNRAGHVVMEFERWATTNQP